jgi:diacylglycerol kinase (ATP)
LDRWEIILMKSRLILNPTSGSETGTNHLPTLNEQLRERVGAMDIVMTVGRDDAARAAAEAAQAGYDTLFVAGGDGTLNQVLNGVARVEGAFARVTFGLIPLGTGNDFAATLGLPESVDEAIDFLIRGRTIDIDLGKLNDRHFINVSAGGFIAEVSEAVNPTLKTIAGKLAYLIGGAQVLFDYEPVDADLRAIADGGVIERKLSLQMFAICNGPLAGGGRIIAPHAVIDDGWLDVCLVEAMPTLEFLGLLNRLSTGDHLEDERVTYFRARELDVRFDHAIKVNTDGEVLTADRCHYHVRPRTARFLVGDVLL